MQRWSRPAVSDVATSVQRKADVGPSVSIKLVYLLLLHQFFLLALSPESKGSSNWGHEVGTQVMTDRSAKHYIHTLLFSVPLAFSIF